jgi:hypothetical protein
MNRKDALQLPGIIVLPIANYIAVLPSGKKEIKRIQLSILSGSLRLKAQLTFHQDRKSHNHSPGWIVF